MYSHKLIALMRVDTGSCGKGDGCAEVDGRSDVDGDVDDEVASTSVVVILVETLSVCDVWVVEAMPHSAVVVPGST